MDEQQNQAQHKEFYERTDKLKERVLILENDYKHLKDDHDGHNEKINENETQIGTYGKWIATIGVGGAVLLFLADALGIFDKLQ